MGWLTSKAIGPLAGTGTADVEAALRQLPSGRPSGRTREELVVNHDLAAKVSQGTYVCKGERKD